MVYWTTPPNFFLVATIDDDEVVGCVSIQKKDDTVSELNRLSVASKTRGDDS
jgi:hypothetical protein